MEIILYTFKQRNVDFTSELRNADLTFELRNGDLTFKQRNGVLTLELSGGRFSNDPAKILSTIFSSLGAILYHVILSEIITKMSMKFKADEPYMVASSSPIVYNCIIECFYI